MTRRCAWRAGAHLLRSIAAAPTGYRLMLKRQKEGESMGTPAQVETVIAMLTAAHADQPASSWDILREAIGDGMLARRTAVSPVIRQLAFLSFSDSRQSFSAPDRPQTSRRPVFSPPPGRHGCDVHARAPVDKPDSILGSNTVPYAPPRSAPSSASSHEMAATVQKLSGVGRLQPRKIRQSLAQQDQLIAFA